MAYYFLEFGRLHPLLVHFPIGVLVVALLFELFTLRGNRPELRVAIRLLVYIGAATAAIAVLFGLLLEYTGSYPDPTLGYHKWTGIATTALATLAAVLVHRAGRDARAGALKLYRGALFASVVLLTVAGHLGASLTHGEGYLSALAPWNYEPPPSGEEYAALLVTLAQHREMGPLAEPQANLLGAQVRQIFARSCYQCHDSDKSEGGLALDTKEAAMEGGDDGAVINPGNPEDSELLRRVMLPAGHDSVMPKKGRRLLREEVALIRMWILEGAPWTDGPARVFPEAQLALEKPTPPPAKQGLEQPIDRFTDAYFAEHGIRWPRPVDDVTFMRRVYLDVIGLLPEPEEVDAFVADRSPDKRDRLIDELLARDDDYAQHWLAFWNDLLRNAYSGPGYITGGRRQITGWLYAALRDNKPYDQMVRELVNPPSDSSEGFVRGIQWRGVVNASQTTQMQAAQNISQALLGTNLKCASCHNSFVSNITLKQAYSFAAIFADSVLEIERCDVPTGDIAAPGFLYPELGTIDPTLDRLARVAKLSDILVDRRNGRLYRTIANRLWERTMGRGLVEPLDAMDREPWSQELLDWLAADLVDHRSDLKYLLSTILHSRTYQLPADKMSEEQARSLDEYVFSGPLVKRLTAEQFADAVGQVAVPMYESVVFDPFGTRIAEASWIWFRAEKDGREVLAPPGTYYFRHRFDLPAGKQIRDANLLVTVDESFSLYVNGALAGQGTDWRQPQRIDVKSRLRAGGNILALAARGGGTGAAPKPAGVLLNLRINFTDGDSLEVRSSPGTGPTPERPDAPRPWKVSNQRPRAGWAMLGFPEDTVAWKNVRGFGSNVATGTNNRPLNWGQLTDFTHDAPSERLRFARASLVQKDPFLTALGLPAREIVTSKRESEPTLLQALEVTNGKQLNETLARGAERWLREYGRRPDELVRRVYLAALSRPPSAREARVAARALGDTPTREGVQDLLWAVLMQPEFGLIH